MYSSVCVCQFDGLRCFGDRKVERGAWRHELSAGTFEIRGTAFEIKGSEHAAVRERWRGGDF